MARIYTFLEKSIFTADDVKDCFASDEEATAAVMELLEDHRIEELKEGMYATVDPFTDDIFANVYEIATALNKSAYCAYHTALEFYGLAQQIMFEVHCIAPRNSEFEIGDVTYRTFRNSYSEGVVELKNYAAPVRITDLERTVVDCIDRYNTAGGIEEVANALRMVSFCNEDKLLKYLKGYNKKILYKKAGFLFARIRPAYLSQRFYDECKSHITSHRDDIRINKVAPFIYDDEWKIYATIEFDS
ncbi:MAG: hypothetical protein LUD51_04810 [Clostridia bacterium]|nr:hypothetical protein [Clostridia bacterium]